MTLNMDLYRLTELHLLDITCILRSYMYMCPVGIIFARECLLYRSVRLWIAVGFCVVYEVGRIHLVKFGGPLKILA